MQQSNKILKTAVVLLLLANLGLVAFMVWGKKGKSGDRPDPYKMMAKELGLTAEQEAEHRKMGEAHMNNTKPLMDSLREIKVAFYMQYKDGGAGDSALNEYSQRTASLQASIDKIHMAHFQKVRQWLKGDQQSKYDTLVKKMMMRGRRSGGKK